MPTKCYPTSTVPSNTRLGKCAHFVFVLQFGGGRNVASPPEGCKVLALRAWLGAGVNAAEFQEILILDDVIMG